MSWFSWASKHEKSPLRDVPTEQLRAYVEQGPRYRYQCIELNDWVTEGYLSGLLNDFAKQGFGESVQMIEVGSKTFLILRAEAPPPWAKEEAKP